MVLEKTKAAISGWTGRRPDARTLVAVSGGPDSVCLLHVLLELAVPLEVAHLDHQTRDGESAEDAEFVRGLARRLGVPCHVESRPVAREAADTGQSFEEAARSARYAFLLRTAADTGCEAVATGHTADDQAETVLLRLLRGTTPKGLAAIPPICLREGISVVRPLLTCTRAEVVAWLEERGIAYRTDRTNADVRFLRNRVRHELLPMLRERFNPRVDEALCRLAAAQRIEDDLLSRMANAALETCARHESGLDRARFRALDPAIAQRVMALMAWRWGVDADYDRIGAAVDFAARGRTDRRFDLGGGVLLANTEECTAPAAPPAPVFEEVAPIAWPGETVAFGHRFRVRERPAPLPENPAAYCSPARQVFDVDAIEGGLCARFRRPGDRIHPLGMAGTKKLKDYLNDIGMPPADRDRQVLLTDAHRILWVVGHGASRDAAVTEATQRILEVEVEDEAY